MANGGRGIVYRVAFSLGVLAMLSGCTLRQDEACVLGGAGSLIGTAELIGGCSPGPSTAARPPTPRAIPAASVTQPASGIPVYSPDECIGPIIMGVCHGQIQSHSAYHPTCYGQMLNGACTGPMF
jgi:hypothetical protein